MSRKKTRKIGTTIGWIFFILYSVLLVYFLFFFDGYGRQMDGVLHYNLEPFREIVRFWKYRETFGMQSVWLNLAGNIIGFMPFGFLLPLLSVRERRLIMVTLLTFELSLVVEVIQLFTGLGSFDVDDLILNTLGGMIGYLCYRGFASINGGR